MNAHVDPSKVPAWAKTVLSGRIFGVKQQHERGAVPSPDAIERMLKQFGPKSSNDDREPLRPGMLGELTASERTEMGKFVRTFALSRVAGMDVSPNVPPNGEPWWQWSYKSAVMLAPAVADGLLGTPEEGEAWLTDLFRGVAIKRGWNVEQCEKGIADGLRAGVDKTSNIIFRKLAEIRGFASRVAAIAGNGYVTEEGTAKPGTERSKSTEEVLMEHVLAERPKTLVLHEGDRRSTAILTAVHFAKSMDKRLFRSTIENEVSRVTLKNGKRASEELADDEWLSVEVEDHIKIYEPVDYAPINDDAPSVPPPGAKTVKSYVHVRGKKNPVVVDCLTDLGVAGAVNADRVLKARAEGGTQAASAAGGGWPGEEAEPDAVGGAEIEVEEDAADEPDMNEGSRAATGTRVWKYAPLMPREMKLMMGRIRKQQDGVSLQRLRGVYFGPQMLANGSVITNSGFACTGADDGDEQAFIDVGTFTGKLRTDMLLEDAKAVIRKLLDCFPCVTPRDAAVLSCVAFATVSRSAYMLQPVVAIDGPSFNAGKSHAALKLSMLNGARPDLIGLSKDGEETAKRVDTTLVNASGGNTQIFDNVPPAGLPEVPSLLTALSADIPTRVRILGKSESATVDPAKLSIILTGVNIQVKLDHVRRTIKARVDSAMVMQDPNRDGWTFEKAAEQLASLDRAEVLSALLTVLEHVRKRGPTKPLLANFGDWSKLIREAAIEVFGADPVDSQNELRIDDDAAREFKEVCIALQDFNRWFLATPDGAGMPGATAGIIAEHILKSKDAARSFGGSAPVPPGIKTLRSIVDGQTEREVSTRLGWKLNARKDAETYDDGTGVIFKLTARDWFNASRSLRKCYVITERQAADATATRLPWERKN